MGAYKIERSELVDAPAGKVWDAILDVASWPEWKPFITKVNWKGGELGCNDKFTMNIKVKGPAAPVSVRVCYLDKPSRVAWTGGLPGLATSVHSFLLEEKDGKTEVTTREEFTGALVGLMLMIVTEKDLERLHLNWLDAIKKKVEVP